MIADVLTKPVNLDGWIECVSFKTSHWKLKGHGTWCTLKCMSSDFASCYCCGFMVFKVIVLHFVLGVAHPCVFRIVFTNCEISQNAMFLFLLVLPAKAVWLHLCVTDI